MKCPACATENPDYSYYCGKCGEELRWVSEPAKAVPPSHQTIPASGKGIEEILDRNLPRIEENIARRRGSYVGRFRGALHKPGVLVVFKSGVEVVNLSISQDGHILVSKGCPPGPWIVLKGPHDAILGMFENEHGVRHIPDSIEVLLGDDAMPSDEDSVFRYEAERLLHMLFQ